ncbi:MAG: esterase family protein, partial [bacterium]
MTLRLQTSARAAAVSAALVATLVASSAAPVAAEPLELETVEFFSPAVDRTMKYNIVLPHDYDGSNERYPVLYLLHGLTQNYTA